MRRQKQGLLLYTGSGLSHMVDPFTGVYAASKAAGDSVAQIMALETSRYGIETVIVMPGAFTTQLGQQPVELELPQGAPPAVCSTGLAKETSLV
jgi:short-subunit dehydrogenase